MSTASDPQARAATALSDSSPVERALALSRDRLGGLAGANGESVADHAQATVGILQELFADEMAQVAAALFGGTERLPLDDLEREFGRPMRELVDSVRQVVRLREVHLKAAGSNDAGQLEILRRMTLAMSADIRVVLIRLASRLQTLRYHAASKTVPPAGLSRETLEVMAPLANRLGLWQLKWELEDLSFRFLEPQAYKTIAAELEEKRHERADFVLQARRRLEEALRAAGIRTEVSGRPKHIYSIHSKMQAKALTVAGIRDLRALRVIVDDVRRCYEALSVIHQLWPAVPEEFDDYIARPKANGYQSLHTVVIPPDGKPLEVQIRTREMHQHAEYGVASHWAYKEGASGAGTAGRAPSEEHERVAWLRQLLAWQREMGATLGEAGTQRAPGSDRIFVLTPQGKVVELPEGATPIDFAYHVHTELGHRCRGARVDGHMVPLNTALQNGQTVEIVSVRKGSGNEGPSRDWLNTELGYIKSMRSRAKVRQWFNARELEHDLGLGRERVERVMQREGKTALAFEDLARRLGFPDPAQMFTAVAREEIGPRVLEEAMRGTVPAESPDAAPRLQPPVAPATARSAADGGVLVVGVDLLLTQLARCCRPAPPDAIAGFVTRGHGVSVHRAGCKAFERMKAAAPERVLDTTWGRPASSDRRRHYPVDVLIEASDRPGLLRDVSDVFARDKLNVVAVNTLSRGPVAHMQFTVEVPDTAVLARALSVVNDVAGVYQARRKSP